MNVTETVKSMTVESKILGDAQIFEFRDICMDFEPCLNVHPLISVQHKCTGLQWSNDPSQHDISCGSVTLSIG